MRHGEPIVPHAAGGVPRARRSDRARHVAFAAYVVVCLAALTWPGYAWLGNSIEPRLLGIPFSLAWVIGWVLLTFAALAIYHATDRGSDGGTERR